MSDKIRLDNHLIHFSQDASPVLSDSKLSEDATRTDDKTTFLE
jgi:hypothetical protein